MNQYTDGMNAGFLLGVLLMLLLCGGIYCIVRIRLHQAKARASEASNDQHRSRQPDQSARQLAEGLHHELMYVGSVAQGEALRRKINDNWSLLSDDARTSLISDLEKELVRVKEREAQQAVLEATMKDEVARLRAITDHHRLFEELHSLVFLGQDSAISYDKMAEVVSDEDVIWIERRYDVLLLEELRSLIGSAREGSIDAYVRIMELRRQLDDFVSDERDDFDEFVERHLCTEWNEMIVQYQRKPEWDDDLFGFDDMEASDYEAVIRGVEVGDLLSLQYARLLLEEEDDELLELLAEKFTALVTSGLDKYYDSRGFIGTRHPDARVR